MLCRTFSMNVHTHTEASTIHFDVWWQLFQLAGLQFLIRGLEEGAGWCEANRGRRLIRRRGRRHQKSITAPLQLLCFSPPFLWMKSQVKFFVAKSLSYIHTCPVLAVKTWLKLKCGCPSLHPISGVYPPFACLLLLLQLQIELTTLSLFKRGKS